MNFLRGIFRTGSFDTHRLDAFSDGVFSIVITLLILEIRVPQIHGENISQELVQGLILLSPKFFCYVLSFAYISIYWVNHHQLFHVIERSDRGLFWFNSLFLMFLAFIPFPTALIGEYPREHVAVIFYGVAMLAAAVSFGLMKWYAVDIGKLVDPDIESKLLKTSVLKILVGPLLYLFAIAAAFWNTDVAILTYVIIPIIYFIPSQAEKIIFNTRRMKRD